jgi:hypothetical protein
MNGRLAVNYISRYVRMGGFGCYGNIDPSNTSTSINGYGTVITAVDGSSNAPDELTVVTAARRVGVVDDGDGTPNESFSSISTIPIGNLVDDIDDIFDTNKKKYTFLAPCENTNFLTINTVTSGASPTITLTNSIRVEEGAEIFTIKAYTFSLKQPAEYSNPKPSGPNLVINENTGANRQEVAENITNLQFQYGWDRNGDGHFDPTDNNEWSNDPGATSNEADVRAVRIYVLSRSAHPDREYTDRKTYKINDATSSSSAVFIGPFNDGYHRFLLRTTIMIRNLNF